MASAFDDNDEITGINVTPLVDVMLVLLIIFMVTATYISNQAINIQLPKASTGDQVGSKNLAFVIDKVGHVTMNGKATTFEALPAQLVEERTKTKDLQALISADQSTTHGTVVKLIDLIRKSGITEFAINVEAQ